jgi:hypothetical protein
LAARTLDILQVAAAMVLGADSLRVFDERQKRLAKSGLVCRYSAENDEGFGSNNSFALLLTGRFASFFVESKRRVQLGFPFLFG